MRDGAARLAQLLSLYFALFHLGPFLATQAPWLGPIGAEVVSVIAIALVTELVIASVISRPEIVLTWQDGSNPNALKEIVVDSGSLTSGRARFDLSIEAKPGTSLGALAFWFARGRGLRMRVEFPSAPVYFIVDFSTPIRSVGKTVTEVHGSFGVDVLLDTRPVAPTWVWARLVMQPVPPIDSVTNRPFPLRVAFHASTAFGRFCARVIKTRPTARILVLHK